MTAKEKAEELVLKFKELPQEGTLMFYVAFEISKQCALIAVDETIKVLEEVCDDRGYDPFEAPLYTLKYWQEVKQEISNI
jgi:hypothetical protein